jgi:hypothetical protein
LHGVDERRYAWLYLVIARTNTVSSHLYLLYVQLPCLRQKHVALADARPYESPIWKTMACSNSKLQAVCPATPPLSGNSQFGAETRFVLPSTSLTFFQWIRVNFAQIEEATPSAASSRPQKEQKNGGPSR